MVRLRRGHGSLQGALFGLLTGWSVMRVALFESASAGFGPIAQLRPDFELICGQFSARERAIRTLSPSDWGVFLREELAETWREQHPESHVNDIGWLKQDTTLLLCGRWLARAQTIREIEPHTVGVIDGTVVWLTAHPAEAELFDAIGWESALYEMARTRTRVPASGRLVSFAWELSEQNSAQLEADFVSQSSGSQLSDPAGKIALVGPRERVSIDPTARLEPFVVLDATRGPVSIGAGAAIQSFTRLEGPCHVGIGAQLFRANVRAGTTIGAYCRVGGEIEASILHSHVNKYHDGFLGHSYVCPWVNLGALTTNSDLKNDYSNVRVPLEGKSIDTRLTKVGCFIGDHTKTGLGSLFNTGSSIGVMCMILPGGELLPRHIPSFTAVWHGELADAIPFERNLAAARTAMGRRNHELTGAQERLLRFVHGATQTERAEAIALAREKRAAARAPARS